MILRSQFKPAWWLKNRHAQTIWQSLFRKQVDIAVTRERFELPDGDFLDIDQSTDFGNDISIILHGLEGRLDAKYAGMVKTLSDQQHTTILMYHRSCSGEINRLAKSYHSGFTDDIHFMMQIIKQRYPGRRVNLIAYSLGASIALNYLAKFPENVLPDFTYAISTPFCLQNSADQLNKGFARIYRRYLLKRMMQKVKQKKHFTELQNIDINMLDKCRDFNIFDDQYTAKVNGFTSGAAYYQQCSSMQHLQQITRKVHILHAADDPFMTTSSIPSPSDLPDNITLELSDKGGHVGFICGNTPFTAKYWTETRLLELLNQV